MNKNEICFIRAKQRGDDYFHNAVKKMGYEILIPYKDNNLLFRCLREIWFRMKLPYKVIWFNKQILTKSPKVFVVKDPLIVPAFLVWMRKNFPHVRIILDYDNRASMSLNPNLIAENIAEKWSYDESDCNEYGMRLRHGSYFDIFAVKPADHKEYDVLYLGRDKGRASELFDIEKKLNGLGLKTLFYICADRRFLRFKKNYYMPYMPYMDYISLLAKSRAILNVVQPGQKSITMREYEAVFDNIKCITNNVGILDFELYHPSRYFILGKDKIDRLNDFMKDPFVPVQEEVLKKYTFDEALNNMIHN